MARDDERRPDPDSLLEISREEERGKLTIYFGFSPGVGKTYAMLHDAALKKQEGIDVVIGYYETHARPETEKLLEGLEIVPPRMIDYKGVALKEMDLEAILRRRPRLVLVDELAHTNAPGMRHLKRYQDVEELLNAGIDVNATLNVQHLESYNDVLFQITGIRVQEKVPDTIFHAANEVKLIDLPYEELFGRLKEGKVYVKDLAEEAVRRFFQPGTLMALRQIALRVSAGRVDEQMRKLMRARAIAGPWAASERILVSVYASPYAERLVRSASRLAMEMEAEWVALYVEGVEHAGLSDREKRWLTDALDLARKLGALVVWTRGDAVADEISRYAQNNNITKIVMGKPGRLWFFPTIVRKIMTRTRNIDIFLFAGEEVRPVSRKRKRSLRPGNYIVGLLGVAVAAAIGFFLGGWLGESNLLFLMLLPVVGSALFLGIGPSLFTAVASILAFDFMFIEPYYTMSVAEPKDFLTFIVYIVVAVAVSNLASKLRSRVEMLQRSESRSMALCDVGRHLVATKNVDQVLAVLIQHARKIVPGEIAIFLPRGEEFVIGAATDGFEISPKEIGVASWVLINGKPAGQATETLPQAWARYIPMWTADAVKGVMGIHTDDPERYLLLENAVVLDTIAGMGAFAIEAIEAQQNSVKK